MSDLDKLMQKLKKDKEKPVAVEELPEIEEVVEDEEDPDEDEEDEEEEAKPVKKVVKAIPKEDPVEIEEEMPDFEQSIEAEVGLFQNNGIFRRELLIVEKERNDLLRAIAQILIENAKATKK